MDEVLAERTQQIALDNLAAEINKKWPTSPGEPTTWDIILKAREDKIAVAKKNRIREKAKSDKFFDTVFEWLKNIAILTGVAILSVIVGYYIWINRCQDTVC